MARPAVREVALVIVCDDAPETATCVAFGLQDKDGDLHPGTPAGERSLRFEATVTIVEGGSGPRLRGSIVHGRPDGPFAYLSCRAPAGEWRFRLKVPLAGVADAVAGAADPVTLTARVRATGGGSVPLLSGWTPGG